MIHSVLLSISWKVWTCSKLSINWNQLSICGKCQFFFLLLHCTAGWFQEIEFN